MCGVRGSWTELTPGPMVLGAVVDVTQLSRETVVLAHGEQICCGTDATQDVPRSAGASQVEHAGENPCTCGSERVSISPVGMHS